MNKSLKPNNLHKMIKLVLRVFLFLAAASSQSCSSSEYYDSGSSSCVACDYRCNGCDGPHHWDCLACASGKKNVEGTSLKCLSVCYATMYQSGSTCYCRLL